jgi:hypothetical protein
VLEFRIISLIMFFQVDDKILTNHTIMHYAMWPIRMWASVYGVGKEGESGVGSCSGSGGRSSSRNSRRENQMMELVKLSNSIIVRRFDRGVENNGKNGQLKERDGSRYGSADGNVNPNTDHIHADIHAEIHADIHADSTSATSPALSSTDLRHLQSLLPSLFPKLRSNELQDSKTEALIQTIIQQARDATKRISIQEGDGLSGRKYEANTVVKQEANTVKYEANTTSVNTPNDGIHPVCKTMWEIVSPQNLAMSGLLGMQLAEMMHQM